MKKKYLIKARPGEHSALTMIPMLIALREEHHEDVHIDVLVDEGETTWLKELELGFVNFIEIPKAKKSMMGLHQFSIQKNEIFGIDTFIDFEGTGVSATLGSHFKAKIKIGPDGGLKKMLYQKHFPTNSLNSEHDYFQFLSWHLNRDLQFELAQFKERTRVETENAFNAERFEDFILFYGDFSKLNRTSLTGLIDGIKDIESFKLLVVDPFSTKLDQVYAEMKENLIEVFFQNDLAKTDLLNLATKVRGLISTDSIFCHLIAMSRINSILIEPGLINENSSLFQKFCAQIVILSENEIAASTNGENFKFDNKEEFEKFLLDEWRL